MSISCWVSIACCCWHSPRRLLAAQVLLQSSTWFLLVEPAALQSPSPGTNGNYRTTHCCSTVPAALLAARWCTLCWAII